MYVRHSDLSSSDTTASNPLPLKIVGKYRYNRSTISNDDDDDDGGVAEGVVVAEETGCKLPVKSIVVVVAVAVGGVDEGDVVGCRSIYLTTNNTLNTCLINPYITSESYSILSFLTWLFLLEFCLR